MALSEKFLDGTGLSQVWSKMTENFTAKEEGKGLSENDYTDAEKAKTLYKNQTPSTVEVGGIPKGYVPPSSGVEAVEMLDKLLHAYVAPQVTAVAAPTNGGVFEIGTSKTVTSVTVNITLGSAAITKIEVKDGSSILGSLTSGITAGGEQRAVGFRTYRFRSETVICCGDGCGKQDGNCKYRCIFVRQPVLLRGRSSKCGS